MKNIDKDHILQLLSKSRSILITSHHNPDGDAIGSIFALALVLNKMGKKAIPMVPNDYPDFLKWVPGHDLMMVFDSDPEKASEVILAADLIFCLDYNALHRTGKMEGPLRSATAAKILIDHHLEPVLEDFDYYLSEIAVSSTSELVYKFIIDAGMEGLLDESSATGLYVGIMTDTGSFSYSCDYPDTFRITSELVRKGISPGTIHRLVYDTYSESRLRLLGFCLGEKLTVLPEYHTAYIALSKAELERFNHKVGDTEGIVNYALSIEGIKLAVFMTERDDRIRLSFRSRGNFSVNTLAREHFKGGGHMNAAGGDSFVSLNETIRQLKLILAQYKSDLDRS